MGHVSARILAGLAAALLWIGSFFGAIIALFVAASAAEPGQANTRGETWPGASPTRSPKGCWWRSPSC